jgi:methylthioribose-1-phosphate isomerase
MLIKDEHFTTIWLDESNQVIKIIDQRFLPFRLVIETIHSSAEMCLAISEMHLRGAGLIGVAAAWGIYLACKESTDWDQLQLRAEELMNTRPTAINLQNAVDKMLDHLQRVDANHRLEESQRLAQMLSQQDIDACKSIGLHGAEILRTLSKKKNGQTINVLTHCNAGWLAFVDYGSALAPVYEFFNHGYPVHVYVDETRPRNQGARLTAWELAMQGVPHTLIVDNAGGHLMQKEMIDLVIVGADRVSRKGDVANKIGTYLKALAAFDNKIPFYVAFPSSTFDASISDGLSQIPIEARHADEVLYMQGIKEGEEFTFRIAPEATPALNFGFDVTPARLISGYITEFGAFDANQIDSDEWLAMFE